MHRRASETLALSGSWFFLIEKQKLIYICMSFSFLLLALHALQTELGKKIQLGLNRRDNQPGAGGSLESTIID